MLCNRPASGTEVIERLGDEHVRTGRPIVYTSADSVFQIACHEDVVPVSQLYEWCAIARGILQGPHAVGRVIARPFEGTSGNYRRTPRRRDFSLPPTGPTYLDLLQERGVPVVGVGKIGEIFVQRGVDVDDHTTDNTAGIAACARHLREMDERAAVRQPGRLRHGVGPPQRRRRASPPALAAVDAAVPGWIAALRPGDAMILCADHGVDPTTASTDHSREYSPLLALGLAPGATTALRRTSARRRSHLLTGEAPPLAGAVIGGADVDLRRAGVIGAPGERLAGLARRRRLRLRPGGRAAGLPVDGRVAVRASWDGRSTDVAGHPNRLLVARSPEGERPCLACGRPHPYEGWTRRPSWSGRSPTSRAWGVRAVVLTCAAGGLTRPRAPGALVVVDAVVDLQSPPRPEEPPVLAATAPALCRARRRRRCGRICRPLRGRYAAVCGPAVRDACRGGLAGRPGRRGRHVRRARGTGGAPSRPRRGDGRGRRQPLRRALDHDEVLSAGARLQAGLQAGLAGAAARWSATGAPGAARSR